jgi:Cation-independent mannose-6-phosphate receptor repeat
LFHFLLSGQWRLVDTTGLVDEFDAEEKELKMLQTGHFLTSSFLFSSLAFASKMSSFSRISTTGVVCMCIIFIGITSISAQVSSSTSASSPSFLRSVVSAVVPAHRVHGVLDSLCGISANGTTVNFAPAELTGNNTYSYESSEYSLQMNMCGAVSASNRFPKCALSNGSVCQYANNMYVATLARWPQDYQPTWSVTNQGDTVVASFSNGDECFPTGTPRSMDIRLQCDRSETFMIDSFTEADVCAYVLSVRTKYACGLAPACGLNSFGHTFDFSPLTLTTDSYAVSDAQYLYDFNVCGVAHNVTDQCKTSGASCCQYAQGMEVATLSKWFGPDSVDFSLIDPSDPTKGVQMTSANGDVCFPSNQPRLVTTQFTCSPDAIGKITVVEGTYNPCTYVINFPTKYACVN